MAALSPLVFPEGFRFGPYLIDECIGRGGMARVYRARHMGLHKNVALKILESSLLNEPEGRRRFLIEGQAAAAVKHPNVVNITDVGVYEGLPYLIMEFLDGEDFEAYLGRNSPIEEGELARVMLPVIAGLAVAHDSGVVHRDLKPSNIFLSRGPEGEIVPKILDFGISKLSGKKTFEGGATSEGHLMGTPLYMPPEGLHGARDLTHQADQYSLGIVLYEALTGKTPFQGHSLLALLEAIQAGEYPRLRQLRPHVSVTLEQLVTRMMSLDPQDRFDSVRDAGRVLMTIAGRRTRTMWARSFGLDLSTISPSVAKDPTPGAARHASLPSNSRGGLLCRLKSAAPQFCLSRKKRYLGIPATAVLVAGAWLYRTPDPPRHQTSSTASVTSEAAGLPTMPARKRADWRMSSETSSDSRAVDRAFERLTPLRESMSASMPPEPNASEKRGNGLHKQEKHGAKHHSKRVLAKTARAPMNVPISPPPAAPKLHSPQAGADADAPLFNLPKPRNVSDTVNTQQRWREKHDPMSLGANSAPILE